MTSVQAALPEQSNPCRRWLLAFGLLLCAGFVALYVFIVLIDPYSSGRLALTQRIDSTTTIWGLAKAGVIRDPQFDTAILGTSAAMRLDPARISEASGRRVVQLALPGSQPQNQLVLARAFARFHNRRPSALVFVLDIFWCRTPEEQQKQQDLFPLATWLYGDSEIDYALRIFHPEAFYTALKRVAIWLDLLEPSARSDGYLPLIRPGDPDVLAERLRRAQPPTVGPGADEPFPALDWLEAHVASLPAHTHVAFVFAPIAANLLPVAGSPAEARMSRCKERVRRIAERRLDSRYLDLRIDHPVTRDLSNFEDETHYRSNVARWIEAQIAPLIADSHRAP